MSELEERSTREKTTYKYLIPLLLILGLVIVAVAAGYFIYPQTKEPIQEEVPPEPEQSGVFMQPLILSLSEPVIGTDGITYSGVVQFDPTTETYSYIATEDEGLLQPVGPTSFSSGPFYLAVHYTEETTNLVLYDRESLEAVRTVKQLPAEGFVSFAAWSPAGDLFAYQTTGIPGVPPVVIENTEATEMSTLQVAMPIGFSPDGTKFLARSVPSLQIFDSTTGELIGTTSPQFASLEPVMQLSPSSQHLVMFSDSELEWYAIDWQTGNVQYVGSISSNSRFTDILFSSEDELVVREANQDILSIYGHSEEGVTLHRTFKVQLPEGAHILNVVSR